MGLDDLPGNHRLAELRLDMLHESAGEEAAARFESRYVECLDQGASKNEAEHIAVLEILIDGGEEAERIGDGYASIDGLRHETEQWREQAGVSPPNRRDLER